MPLISIIIPSYQSGHCIGEALDSILAQSFTDYEVWIIDGNSSDSTDSVVAQYLTVNPHIKWISEPDKGIYDAMNKGVKLANGQWIYFLGSDDKLYDKCVLKDMSKIMNNTSADILYGNAIVLSDGHRHEGEVSLMTLLTSHNLCHQAIFYRKDVFDKIGFYNLKYPVVADWDFNIRCFQNENIQAQYIVRDIVLFNNLTGVSSLTHTDPFYDMVPVTYIKQLNIVKQEKNDIILSRSYIIGRAIYAFLKKTGFIALLNKFRS
ncbi:glycosyltransferase family 2 protein [Hymenobacter sp. HD11105]